jgi:hypothetical protein
MNALTARLAELNQQRNQVALRAHAIAEKPELTANDRRVFEECLELVKEIEDFSARLQRAGEKWRNV